MTTGKNELQNFLEKSSGGNLGENSTTILEVLNNYGKNEKYYTEDKITIKEALSSLTSGMGTYGNTDKFPSAKVTMDNLGRPTLIDGTAKYGYEQGAFKLYYSPSYNPNIEYSKTLKPVSTSAYKEGVPSNFLLNNAYRAGSENGKQAIVYCGAGLTYKYDAGKGQIITNLEPMDMGFALVAGKELTLHPGDNSFSWFGTPTPDDIKIRYTILRGPSFSQKQEYSAVATVWQSKLAGPPGGSIFNILNYKNDNIQISFTTAAIIINSSAEEDIVIPEGQWLCHLATSYLSWQVGM